MKTFFAAAGLAIAAAAPAGDALAHPGTADSPHVAVDALFDDRASPRRRGPTLPPCSERSR